MEDDLVEVTATALKRKMCDPRVEDGSNHKVQQLFDLLPLRAFHSTFPDCADAPAEGYKSFSVPLIADHGAADLGLPELGPCFWPVKHRTVVAVPEATIYENHNVMAGKNKIWLAGQLTVMQPKSEAASVKPAPDHHFWLRVTAHDSGHVPAAGFAVVDVSQPEEPPADCHVL